MKYGVGHILLNRKKDKRCYQKKTITQLQTILFIVVLILTLIATSGCTDRTNTIKISGAFAIYPMVAIWSEEYQKIHPDINIELSGGGAGQGMSDALHGIVDLGMVSREIYQTEIDQGIFWVSVVKDAVVVTFNEKNPAYETLLSTGVTRQELENIFITREITTWGQLIGDPRNTNKINVYTRSDACGAAQVWAKYLGNYSQDDLTNNADSAIKDDPNLAAVVQNDINGIGYNNINFVYDFKSKRPFDGIRPIPIDLNENGVLDEDEQFYETRDDIVRAIANNIYPSPPARASHLVTKEQFTGVTKDFVYWILTDGQEYIEENGYIRLPDEMIADQLHYLETGVRPETSN